MSLAIFFSFYRINFRGRCDSHESHLPLIWAIYFPTAPLDCLYLLASNLTDIINIAVYYQIIPFIASIFLILSFPSYIFCSYSSTVTIFPSSSQRSCQSFAPGQRNTCPFTRRLFLSSVAILAISSSVSGSSVRDFKLLT